MLWFTLSQTVQCVKIRSETLSVLLQTQQSQTTTVYWSKIYIYSVNINWLIQSMKAYQIYLNKQCLSFLQINDIEITHI